MDMTPIDGRNLVAVGWKHNVLFAHFRNGDVNQYGGVPEQVKTSLIESAEPDLLFSLIVVNRYPWERVMYIPPSRPYPEYQIDWKNLPF